MYVCVCDECDSPLASAGIVDPWPLPLSKQSNQVIQLILITNINPIATLSVYCPSHEWLENLSSVSPTYVFPWLICLCISQDSLLFNQQISSLTAILLWLALTPSEQLHCRFSTPLCQELVVIMAVTLYISNIDLQELVCCSSLNRFLHSFNPCQGQKEAWSLWQHTPQSRD